MPEEIEGDRINGLESLVPISPGSGLVKSMRTTCAGCEYSAKEGADRVCRFEPPKVFMFLIPTTVPGPRGPQQGAMPQSFTQFPVVQDGQWCGKAILRRDHP
jgi:hypothetical protein